MDAGLSVLAEGAGIHPRSCIGKSLMIGRICFLKFALVNRETSGSLNSLFMKEKIHPKYVDAEIRCACGNVIKTRSTRPTILIGICNVCHPFYTGTQKFVDTAGRVDKFQQRLAKTQAAQAATAATKKRK
jgi:large subunit ribosomal protein L31